LRLLKRNGKLSSSKDVEGFPDYFNKTFYFEIVRMPSKEESLKYIWGSLLIFKGK
jgi:hypothetical protein